jgi:hypothetical protein
VVRDRSAAGRGLGEDKRLDAAGLAEPSDNRATDEVRHACAAREVTDAR